MARPPSSPVLSKLAADKIGTSRLTQFALSAAATLTVVAGLIPTGFAVTGITGVPLAFVLLGIVLLIFCVGYNAMTRKITNTGAFYAYIAQGLSRPAGVAAAWVALFSYNLLQVGLYGIFGGLGAPLLNDALGWSVPWWGYALVAWAIVGVAGLAKVEFNGAVLSVLMILEVGIVLLYFAAFVAHPAGGHLTVTTFSPDSLFGVNGWGSLLVIAGTGFVGFESAAFYSEEAKQAHRTVPLATYITVVLIAVLYALQAWAQTVVVGPDHIAAAAQGDPDLVFSLAATVLSPAWATAGHALLLTSILAAMISYHGSAARYVFSLGRENVLPRLFARTVQSTNAPLWGSLTQTLIGLAVIVIYAVAGLDPLAYLFFWLGTSGGFGVLVLLVGTSISVIGYFRRHAGANAWSGLIAPALATLLMGGAVVMAVINFATLLGVQPDSPARWAFPAAYVVIAVGGVMWALWLRRARPEVYERIGLGHAAATLEYREGAIL